ncbi:Uncharacterised protein [Enterobacter asburiae]|uniref:Uncharacterized protein n=1 Tax=Enterobacter asburiae TaxID=61645 RepID=A0A376FF08_ENTAS|nr:Uncharacterised protein [Enterobacter asburiae]
MRLVSRSITSSDAPTYGARVGFIDHQKIGFGDPRPALARNFFPFGHVDHVDGQIRQLGAERRAQVIAAAFNEDQIQIAELFA